ncbi:MAG: hypothetical protein WCQ57_00440 [Verrucomicrobiota bacterium]
MKSSLLPALCALLFLLPASASDMKDVPHPFLIWTKADITEMRSRMKSDPEFQKQIENYMALEARPPKAGGNPDLLALFKYAVLEDKAAGEGQKKALLKFIDLKMPEAGGDNPEARNGRWREDHTLTAIRYDLLYDDLTEAERKGIEASAEALAVWCQNNPGPWTIGDPGLKPGVRTGWLPNMQWPTMIGAHVLAVATKNKTQIETLAKMTGGWQWYFDNYIADGRFYMEEFAKYYSNIGAMILWCNGLERLGLNQFGWGFTGKCKICKAIAVAKGKTDEQRSSIPTALSQLESLVFSHEERAFRFLIEFAWRDYRSPRMSAWHTRADRPATPPPRTA